LAFFGARASRVIVVEGFPEPPFSAELGLAAALGLDFFPRACELDYRRGKTPETPFTAALGLATAYCFFLRVGVLCRAVVGGDPRTPLLRCARPGRCAWLVFFSAGARGGARCALQALDRGTQADSRGAAECLIMVSRPLPATPLVLRRRYLIVAPRPLPAAPLVVCRRYLIVVHRPLPAAPLPLCRRYLIVVPRLLPAAPLAACRRYFIVVPRPMPAAPLVVRRR
jgi:hypothetical protein